MMGAVLLLMAAAERVAATPMPKPLTAPATWFSPDDYPMSARRAHEEGAVRFALDVSPNGTVTGCRIIETSGYADLDGQTCASAMQHARFSPAINGSGIPIAGTFLQRTFWKMPGPPADDEAGPFGLWGGAMNVVTATAAVEVDAQGKVLRCRVTRAANTSVDPCSAFAIGKVVVAPTVVDGKAVPATVTATTMISVKAPGGGNSAVTP